MNFSEIAYEKRGPVTIIRFNRPEVRNCIWPITHRELVAAWTHFRDDEEAKVAIITGAGDKAFSAGGDLKSGTDLVPVTPAEIAAHNRGERPAAPRRAIERAFSKPIISRRHRRCLCIRTQSGPIRGYPNREDLGCFGVTCRRWYIGLTRTREHPTISATDIRESRTLESPCISNAVDGGENRLVKCSVHRRGLEYASWALTTVVGRDFSRRHRNQICPGLEITPRGESFVSGSGDDR